MWDIDPKNDMNPGVINSDEKYHECDVCRRPENPERASQMFVGVTLSWEKT